MEWEIYDGLKQLGPMSEADVCSTIQGGLPRNAYVRQRGATEWVAIDRHPPFAAALQQRNAPGQWPPPPPPPPPPPLVARRPRPRRRLHRRAPRTPSRAPTPGRRRDASSAAAVASSRSLGVALLLASGAVPYAGVAVPLAAVAAAASLGVVALLVGGLLGLGWACGVCKQPVARSMHFCPSCRASFT